MPLWRNESRLLTRYLLGELAGERLSLLEEKLLADEALYQRLLLVEDELIEAYLHDELSAGRRSRFEALFLAAPRRKARVDLARDLSAAGFAARRVTPPAASARRPRWAPPLDGPAGKAAVPVAVVLTALLVAGGLSFWSHIRQEAGSGMTQSLAAATVALWPSVRSAAAEIPRLELGPATGVVDLQLHVEGREAYLRLAARLETLSGALLWSSGEIRPDPEDPAIVLRLPADVFRSQADRGRSIFYVLIVEGKDFEDRTELVGEYELEVVRNPW